VVRRLFAGLVAVLALAGRPAAAAERWTMIPGRSLTVIGDQSPETLRDVATQIEQFRAVLGSLIPNANRPLPLPTVVFVFGSRRAMEPFVPVRNGKPAAIDGLFVRWPDANHILLSLENFDESAAIIYHEYTHLLVSNAVRSLPPWLAEGLADYYGSYQVAANRRSALIGRPLPWQVALLRSRGMPVRELLAVDSSAALHDESMRRSIFYAESWALTHYLLTEYPNGAAAINRFSAAFAEGAEVQEAFVQAFGAPEELDKQIANYIRRPAFAANRFVFTEQLTVPAPPAPRALSAPEAAAWLGDLQRRVGRDDEAAKRIEAAVAKQPDVPMCQVALGLLRLSQLRTEEGVAALNKADSLAPDDFTTQFLLGVALLRTDRSSDENVAAAGRALTRAVALNPESSDAHAWLAYVQMQSPKTLAEARASIERAMALAPGRLDYRLRYADVRILQGEPNAVRPLLAAIAANKHDSAAARQARSRINAMLAALARAEANRPSGASAADSAPLPPGSARSIETPPDATPSAPEAKIQLQLRTVRDGEQRAYGELTRIECTRGDVRFHVQVNGSELIASARRIEDVELIQYLAVKDFSIGCGGRNPADPVLFTWRPSGGSGAGRLPLAIAVEFVPRDYVP
jgi:tetratricopeptide (TPR) repeat protein